MNNDKQVRPADHAKSSLSEAQVLVLTRHLERSSTHQGRYDAWLGVELIVTSRQPLLDGARALLERGYAPSTLLTMRHKSSARASFIPEAIGELAKWTYDESDRDGPRRRRWRPPAAVGAQDKGAGADDPGSIGSGQPDADVAHEEGHTRAG